LLDLLMFRLRRGGFGGHVISWYLGTCPKNDVIPFSRKRFCALGLEGELELRLELAEIRSNSFSVNSIGQVY